jgi:hypothetical protein
LIFKEEKKKERNLRSDKFCERCGLLVLAPLFEGAQPLVDLL